MGKQKTANWSTEIVLKYRKGDMCGTEKVLK